MTRESTAWSAEAEQSVLGAMMGYDDKAFEKAQPLSAEQFFDPRHRAVYRVIERLSGKSAFDIITVYDALSASDRENVGLQYLNQLVQSVPGSGNVARHAAIVRDKARRRELMAAADKAIQLAAEDGDIGEQIDKITSIFSGIQRQTMKQAPVSLADVALARTEHYEALQNGEVIPGWPTHISKLTEALCGGLRAGGLYILAARPSVGKSSFSQSLAWAAAKGRKKTLFLSQEMPSYELGDRAIASVGRVDVGRLMKGSLSSDEWGRVSEAAEELIGHREDFYVDDQGGLTIADVRAKAKQIPGLSVLVLDYLQLCSGSGDKGANRNAEIEQISRGLKTLAKELGIAIVALSQLNRDVEKRTDKKPTLADLRDSGAIEQDADVVMFLWPVRDLGNSQDLIGLSIAKNRQGARCDIALHFDKPVQRWGESSEPLHIDSPRNQGKFVP